MSANQDLTPEQCIDLPPKERLDYALRSWRSVQKYIKYLSEAEIRSSIKRERSRREPRRDVTLRLVQRLSSIASEKVYKQYFPTGVIPAATETPQEAS